MNVANGHVIRRGLPILLVVAMSACTAPAPWRDEAVGTGTRSDDARWPYWPARMRVHPLSRVVIDPVNGDFLEAHIEFRDEDGHTTRAVGTIRIDLFSQNDAPSAPSSVEWSISLSEPKTNRLHFDEVMRTYFFRLNPGEEPLPHRPVLVVRFVSEDGLLFESSLTLRPKPDPPVDARQSQEASGNPSPDRAGF